MGRGSAILLLLVLASSCAHAPKPGSLGLRSKFPDEKAARAFLARTCSIASGVREAQGVVSMRVKSKEASGQFSATVHAWAPDRLSLEILQPFGGTMAIVKVENDIYTIDVPGKPEQNVKGYQMWAGIPLRWAAGLFLGRVPCLPQEGREAASVSINDDDDLIVESRGESRGPAPETFVYRFREENGAYRPASLHWEAEPRGIPPTKVDFMFSDEDRWEARSDRGQVRALWREKNVVR